MMMRKKAEENFPAILMIGNKTKKLINFRKGFYYSIKLNYDIFSISIQLFSTPT